MGSGEDSGSSESFKPLEQRLNSIASELGFTENSELQEVKKKLNPEQSIEDAIAVFTEYHILGQKLVETETDRSDPRPQIGLIVALAGLKYGNGFIDGAKEDIQDAMTYVFYIGDMEETVSRLRTILQDYFNEAKSPSG